VRLTMVRAAPDRRCATLCYMSEGTGRVGVRELRQNLSVYLRRVKDGETLEVTENGQPVAVLAPLPVKEMGILDRMIAEGRATPAKGNLMEILRDLPALPVGDGPTLTEILLEMREEEAYK